MQLTDGQLFGARYLYCGRCYKLESFQAIALFRRRLREDGDFCVLRPGDVHYNIACEMLHLDFFLPEIILMSTDVRGGVVDLALSTTILKTLKF
jgi:hypothetical protein